MIDAGLRAVRVRRGGGEVDDHVVVEEPLEIRVEGRPLAVLMRTPGEDLDLVAGFLATEGVVDGLDDLVALAHCPDPAAANPGNVVLATLHSGIRLGDGRFARAQRVQHAMSGCGICGKASIDKVFLDAPPLAERVSLDADLVRELPGRLRAAQPRFDATGGLHGAALFTTGGDLLGVREDVGRHNAVDKVLGAQLRADAWPPADAVLVVSSRAGFEIVQKALVARVAAVVAVGAASSLAHDLAVSGRLALYTFVRGGRFNEHG